MRIISQNGEFDFPYDAIALRANDHAIYARFGNADARDILVAVYNDEDMVKKAMNRLITYAGTNMPFFQFPTQEDLSNR